MTGDPCEQLDAYLDDELSPDDRLAFEAHLASCDPCAAELPRLLAVMSALDDAAELAAAKSGAPRLVLVPGGGQAASAAAGDPTDRSRDAAAAIRPPIRRRARWVAAGLVGAIAAAAAITLVIKFPSGPPAAPKIASIADQLGPTRSIEARLTYPGADRYRPLDVARGARSNEAISIERMGELEHAKNWHGVAVAALLAGERERATRFFAQAAATPQVDSDRAALELLDGSQEALERALDDVDRALKAEPNNPTALWNRALVLVGLNLPLAASREFDHVIALGEPGWADEARKRAAALRAEVTQRRTRWNRVESAGQQLIENGTPIPSELITVTGYLTTILYDAVRAAPSRDRVEALLPLAQALDAAYHSDRLTTYVRHTATSDFKIRTPLANIYRELIVKGTLTDPAIDAFLKHLAQTAINDIWLGAQIWTGRVTGNLEEFTRRARAANDPWLEAIAEQEAAKAELERGQLAAAERRLREAIAFTRHERMVYRAIVLEYQLATLLRTMRRPSQVAVEAQLAYRDAIAEGAWVHEMNALADLAASNQQRYANGLARAYLTELRERSDSDVSTGATQPDERYDCARRQYGYQSLASISLLLAEPARARAELSSIPQCGDKLSTPDEQAFDQRLTLQNALVWAEMYRYEHQEQDAKRSHASLSALRENMSTLPGEKAFRAYIEANLLIDLDPVAGRRALREAISIAGKQADDLSIKARAYSFSLLALASGRTGEFAEVITTIAEALAVTAPSMCAVAIAAQDDRSVVAFVDAHGQAGGQYVATRKSGTLDTSALVPASIADRLRSCKRVTVLARAPIIGAGRLLPPDIAWSYLLKGSASPVDPMVTNKQARLVVENPETPPELHLPALGPDPDDSNNADATVLRGKNATPTRVLQAMPNASVIEFHTHGFIANDVSEASYLVLSPESDRHYSLTANDVTQVELHGSPLVILGACHAATSSHSLEGGMGLAEAFLHSGARAVIASPDAVQDLGANAFFRAVRDRVMRGIDPAIAIRDERVRRLATANSDDWASGVVVFE